MLLYHDPAALNPRRVRVFCAEKSIAYETVEVTIATGAHLQPSYRAKHPLSLLPILELADGRVLRESMAICRYLEELYPEPNLFGVDAWERAQIEMWNRHAELELAYPVAQVFRNTHKFWQGRIEQSGEFGEIMRKLVTERLAWFDRELGGREYIAGPRFTVADITAMCAIDFGRLSNVRINATDHPNLKRWHELVSARPSAKA